MTFNPITLKNIGALAAQEKDQNSSLQQPRFLITNKVSFDDKTRFCYTVTESQLTQCLQFCWEMAYGDGKHRNVRSGGTQKRQSKDIFENALTGKIGEIVFYQQCLARNKGSTVSDIDFATYGLGVWDDCDFKITTPAGRRYTVGVKSSEFYANLLLLEVKDWALVNNQVIYKHHDSYNSAYDYIVFCRVHFADKQLFAYNYGEMTAKNELAQIAKQVCAHTPIRGQVVGYIVNADFRHIINAKHIIAKGCYMTQNPNKQGMRLDADNYYVQTGCLRTF